MVQLVEGPAPLSCRTVLFLRHRTQVVSLNRHQPQIRPIRRNPFEPGIRPSRRNRPRSGLPPSRQWSRRQIDLRRLEHCVRVHARHGLHIGLCARLALVRLYATTGIRAPGRRSGPSGFAALRDLRLQRRWGNLSHSRRNRPRLAESHNTKPLKNREKSKSPHKRDSSP